MKVRGVGAGCICSTCDPSGAVPLLTEVKENDESSITFTPMYQRSGYIY